MRCGVCLRSDVSSVGPCSTVLVALRVASSFVCIRLGKHNFPRIDMRKSFVEADSKRHIFMSPIYLPGQGRVI